MQQTTTTGGLVVLKHDTPFIPPLKGVGFLAQTAGKTYANFYTVAYDLPSEQYAPIQEDPKAEPKKKPTEKEVRLALWNMLSEFYTGGLI
jgi:hypothetical protein